MALPSVNSKSLVGHEFNINNELYWFVEEIAINRDNAEVYLCQNERGSKYIAKYYRNRIPSSVVGWSIYNHYGRGRDGSNQVFHEVKSKSQQHSFIINHYHRVRFNARWLILVEYIEGNTLQDLIKREHQSNLPKLIRAAGALGKTLSEWHNNGFAHGDPHLENAIFTKDEKIVLIDYGQIHHRDFSHCRKYHCIKDDVLIRIYEDIEHPSSKLGKGFRFELSKAEFNYDIKGVLTGAFNNSYNENSSIGIFLTNNFQ